MTYSLVCVFNWCLALGHQNNTAYGTLFENEVTLD
jgi:hypothetical protein